MFLKLQFFFANDTVQNLRTYMKEKRVKSSTINFTGAQSRKDLGNN
jgi:hypothetical protein